MSRLDELINELCPDGVEFVNIGSVVNYEQPSKYIVKSTEYNDDFPIPVLTAGQSFILGYTNETENLYNASTENPVIIFDDFTAAFKWVDFPFKVKSSAMKMLTANMDKTTLRYIFHLMGDIGYFSDEHKRLWISIYSEFQIPLPPLPVQKEIVRILDNFTELTAELTARKKQYEYYRDSILENNNYPCKQLGELCKFVRGPFGGALKKECFQEDGFAVYEQQHAIYNKFDFRYYVSHDKFDELKRFQVVPNDLIMSCSGTMGKIAIIPPNAPKGIINQALLKLTAYDDIDVKYLKYCFESTIAKQMNDNARGGAIKNVASVDVLKKIEVKLPPLAEQQRIVEILDRFDSLCNNISSGLPAEIKARHQQYDYYRNKLLTFPKVELEE